MFQWGCRWRTRFIAQSRGISSTCSVHESNLKTGGFQQLGHALVSVRYWGWGGWMKGGRREAAVRIKGEC